MSWEDWVTLTIEGTFTKTLADGTGEITVNLPSPNDEYILMYGDMMTGAVKATAGNIEVTLRNATDKVIADWGGLAGQTTNIRYPFPHNHSPVAPAANGETDPSSVIARLVSGVDKLKLSLTNMKQATSEVFYVRIRIRSRSGVAPTIVTNGGTWA